MQSKNGNMCQVMKKVKLEARVPRLARLCVTEVHYITLHILSYLA